MTTIMRATMVGDVYGRERYGANLGVIGSGVNAMLAIAPFAAANLSLLPGGNTTMLFVLGATCLAAAVIGTRAVMSVGGSSGPRA